MTIHILHTPMHEHRREPLGAKWCFKCRKHLPHDDVLWVMDDPMSYYEPHWAIQCSGCGKDHTLFPGRCYL